MKHRLARTIIPFAFLGTLLLSLGISIALSSAANEPAPRLWTFDADLPGTLPQDFTIGTQSDGRPAGEWKVLQTEQAESPLQVLGQMGKSAEYNTVLINGTSATDIDLRVSFLAIEGKADMGGGLIWRATDDRNYYLTRANPLEQNIRIYRVIKGVRHLLQNFNQTIHLKQWHTLHVIHHGTKAQVFYDDKPVFDLEDQTFQSGRIGLWTKSDAVTYFDDLKLQVLK